MMTIDIKYIMQRAFHELEKANLLQKRFLSDKQEHSLLLVPSLNWDTERGTSKGCISLKEL